MSTQTVVLIPARMESTRLPDKPLKKIAGLPMIVHVAKRSQLASGVDRVVVCTDSPEILMVCEKFGVDVCMTKSTHRNGTERIAEAAERWSRKFRPGLKVDSMTKETIRNGKEKDAYA